MTGTLLRAKLIIPPARAAHVRRPQLVDRLIQGLDGKLTLVSAPAGYGKTTLVSSSLSKRLGAAWVSLDQGENDLGQFWRYVVNAIQTIDPHLSLDAERIVPTSEAAEIQPLLIGLLNEITDRAPNLILVLDDYHAIQSEEVHRSLDYFLEYMPPSVHIIVLTRIDPPLSLGRLRAEGSLTEIRSADLQFSVTEATDFLRSVMKLDLPQEQITLLRGRTEGWVAGLQMAGLSMRTMTRREELAAFVADFAGSHRHILDYLTDEVLAHQADDLQAFLLQTSILDPFNASLCAMLTGNDKSQEVLEYLESSNLFLFPLDENRQWYRYHHLFATLLQHRLAQRPTPERARLHRLAAAWLESHDMIDQAIKHHVEAGDKEEVARLIKQLGAETLQPGALHRLKGWLDRLSPEQLQNDAWLAALMAWVGFFEQQTEDVAIWVDHAHLALSMSETGTRDVQLFAMVLGLQAWLCSQRGEFDRAVALAEKALDILPEAVLLWRGKLYIFLGEALAGLGRTADALGAYERSLQYNDEAGNWVTASSIMAAIWMSIMLRGRLNEARSQYDRLITTVTGLGQSLSATILRLGRVAVLYEQNQLSAVGPELAEIAMLLRYGAGDMAIRVRYLQTIYLLANGQRDEAIRALARLEQGVLAWTTQYEQRLAMGRLMRVYIRLGDLRRARQWSQSIEIDLANLTLLRIEEYLALADIWRFDNSDQARHEGLELLLAAEQLCDEAEMFGIMIDINCLQALLLAATDDVDEALVAIGRALHRAENEGYVRTFIDFGQPMAELLEKAAAANIYPNQARFLLGQYSQETRPPAIGKDKPAIVESLSARELEVLALLATHLTGPEIAEQLAISTNTLKTHTRNIYGKLGVNGRNDAVVKAQALQLL